MNPVEGISVTNSTHKRSSKRLKYKATNLNYYKLGGSPIVEPQDIMTKCKVCKMEIEYREDGTVTYINNTKNKEENKRKWWIR